MSFFLRTSLNVLRGNSKGNRAMSTFSGQKLNTKNNFRWEVGEISVSYELQHFFSTFGVARNDFF